MALPSSRRMRGPEYDDPVVASVRKIREEISAEFGHDPVRHVEYLIERQKLHAGLLVSFADDDTEKAKDPPSA
jgi:hypothetical protein